MTTPACPSYAGYRFPAEIISHGVWLYFRFPLSLRMVDELLAARGIIVATRPCANGRASSARASRTRSGAGCPRPETNGTSTRSC